MAVLPTGTVTFLFTDIEGSTKLWERDAEAMRLALSRHDGIVRSAVEDRGGFVFKTLGDAFCCAFSSAPEALGAAISAQRALHYEGRGEGSVIRVRMALHTGARPCSRWRPRSLSGTCCRSTRGSTILERDASRTSSAPSASSRSPSLTCLLSFRP